MKIPIVSFVGLGLCVTISYIAGIIPWGVLLLGGLVGLIVLVDKKFKIK